MISAINSNKQPSFTSVMPVRVFIDGMETTNKKLIQTSCRQLSKMLSSASKNDGQKRIMQTFAQYDKQYIPELSKGYSCKPSEMFKCIVSYPKNFFISGKQAKEIQIAGENVGKALSSSKARGIDISFDLMVARKNYAYTIDSIIAAKSNRLTEINEGSNKPLTLNINMKSNGKYGLSTFKMQPESINFIA